MKPFRLLIALALCATVITGQGLPNLPNKPRPRFLTNSFCPPEGLVSSSYNDPDLNRAKNRVDHYDRYFPVSFDVIKRLGIPEGVRATKRSKWEEETRKAVAKLEGTPVQIEGFLALTERSGRFYGGWPTGPELCNCKLQGMQFYDYHLWIVKRVGDKKSESIVVEMTPHVRAYNAGWTIRNLSYIGIMRLPVRVSGWLLLDQEHGDGIKRGHRANIWEIHPVMKFEYKEAGEWKTL